MQFLDKLRSKHRFWAFSIDVLSGAGASLALPPLFILPAIFLIAIPVWQVIQAPSRGVAARIFGAAGLGWFLASTYWVSHALIVDLMFRETFLINRHFFITNSLICLYVWLLFWNCTTTAHKLSLTTIHCHLVLLAESPIQKMLRLSDA